METNRAGSARVPDPGEAMQAFVINLARSVERRSHISAQLDLIGVSYEIVTAVDGRDLDLADPAVVDPSRTSRSCGDRWVATWSRRGVAACALSHMVVRRRILDAGLPAAVVLEDDVTLDPGLIQTLDCLPDHLERAEVALLHFDTPGRCLLTPQGGVTLVDGRQLLHPAGDTRIFSAAAYVITREACARMEAAMRPVRCCPDEWNFYRDQGVLDRLRCVTPPPVSKEPRFESTIEYVRPRSPRGRARELLLHRLPSVDRLIVARRRRIFERAAEIEVIGSESSPATGTRR